MSLSFDRAGDQSQDWAMKAILYGDSGAGKTFACSLLDNVLIVALEPQAVTTIRSVNPEALVEVINKSGKMTVEQQIHRLLDVVESLKETDYPQIKTVVVDSLTELYELLLENELQNRNATKPNWDDRNAAGRMFKNIVKSFRDLQKNIVFVTLSKQIQDDNNAIHVKSGPTDSLSEFTYKSCNVVGRIFARQDDDGGVSRVVQLEPTETVRVKKHPALDNFEHPHLQKWIDKINGWVATGKNMYSVLENDSPVIIEDPPKKNGAGKLKKKKAALRPTA